MQINVLESNIQSIITLLNILPYLFDGRHPIFKYMHVVIELLKIEYGS